MTSETNLIQKLCKKPGCTRPPRVDRGGHTNGLCYAHRGWRLCRLCLEPLAKWVTAKAHLVCLQNAKAPAPKSVRVCPAEGCTVEISRRAKACRTHGSAHRRIARQCEVCGTPISHGAKRCPKHSLRLERAKERRKERPVSPAMQPRSTQISEERREYLRTWRKTHPKGPPCSKCGEKLMQPPQGKNKESPLCMACRVSTGQIAEMGLQNLPRYDGPRDELGMFLSREKESA